MSDVVVRFRTSQFIKPSVAGDHIVVWIAETGLRRTEGVNIINLRGTKGSDDEFQCLKMMGIVRWMIY